MALIHIGFYSHALHMCVSCDVILPDKAKGPHRVLWLLHGARDDQTAWQRRTPIDRYVEPLEMAVVMPAAQLSRYSDMAHGGAYFTYIADELPRVMRGFFDFSDKREDNYIAGLSMGAEGSLKIGLARPEQYAAIGAFSGGYDNLAGRAELTPIQQRWSYRTYGEDGQPPQQERPLDNAHAIIESGKPAPRIYHACGKDDMVLHQARMTRDFFQSLPGNPFDYTYVEDEGGHTWPYWDHHIQQFLLFIQPGKV